VLALTTVQTSMTVAGRRQVNWPSLSGPSDPVYGSAVDRQVTPDQATQDAEPAPLYADAGCAASILQLGPQQPSLSKA
jgi:hypothetical protein